MKNIIDKFKKPLEIFTTKKPSHKQQDNVASETDSVVEMVQDDDMQSIPITDEVQEVVHETGMSEDGHGKRTRGRGTGRSSSRGLSRSDSGSRGRGSDLNMTRGRGATRTKQPRGRGVTRGQSTSSRGESSNERQGLGRSRARGTSQRRGIRTRGGIRGSSVNVVGDPSCAETITVVPDLLADEAYHASSEDNKPPSTKEEERKTVKRKLKSKGKKVQGDVPSADKLPESKHGQGRCCSSVEILEDTTSDQSEEKVPKKKKDKGKTNTKE